MRSLHLSAAAALLLGACTAGPDYPGPPRLGTAASPGAQFVRGGDATLAAAPALSHWWLGLDDPVLHELEARALQGNPSIEAAQARVRRARSAVRLERANRLPQLAASGMYAHAELPGVDLGGGEPGDRTSLDFFNLGLNANWELEFAGGQRRTIEAANAQAEAAAANVADAQVQLTAEVGQAYVNLRERQHRGAALRLQQSLLQEMLALTEQRFERGTTSLVEVERARSALEAAAPDLAAVEAEREIYLNALAVLTGSAPGTLDPLLATPSAIPAPPAQVAVGDPGALLQRRPDIRAAERAVAAATGRIGAAEAARYPRISFMGILGLGGTSPADLDPGDIAAIALPQIQWSFLDFGRNSARVNEAEASRDEAEAQYRETVLAALQDAEDSLARFGHHRQAVAALARIHASAERRAALTRERYTAGVGTRTDDLDAQRQVTVAWQNLQTAQAALTGSFIAVQKSLGLGWTEAGS